MMISTDAGNGRTAVAYIVSFIPAFSPNRRIHGGAPGCPLRVYCVEKLGN
jgi:hypothetical protein